LGFFIGAAYFKKEITDALSEGKNGKLSYARMYNLIEKSKENIFKNLYCIGNIRIQDCSKDDQIKIFEGRIPKAYWYDISALIETTLNCSGLGEPLNHFYFTNYT